MHPVDLGVAVASERGLKLAEGEWAKLLDTDNSDVVGATLLTLGCQVVVELTTDKQDFTHLSISDELWVRVLDDVLEA